MAKVSENTLFLHFESKKNLFWHSLRCEMEVVKSRLDSCEGIQGEDPSEAALPRIAGLVVETINSSPRVLRLMAIACIELQGDIEALCCEVFSPILEELSKCLAESSGSGAIVKVNPSLLAAALAIALLNPKLTNLTVGNSLSSDDFPAGVQVYSKFWLDLLSPNWSVPESKTPQLELLTNAGP